MQATPVKQPEPERIDLTLDDDDEPQVEKPKEPAAASASYSFPRARSVKSKQLMPQASSAAPPASSTLNPAAASRSSKPSATVTVAQQNRFRAFTLTEFHVVFSLEPIEEKRITKQLVIKPAVNKKAESQPLKKATCRFSTRDVLEKRWKQILRRLEKLDEQLVDLDYDEETSEAESQKMTEKIELEIEKLTREEDMIASELQRRRLVRDANAKRQAEAEEGGEEVDDEASPQIDESALKSQLSEVFSKELEDLDQFAEKAYKTDADVLPFPLITKQLEEEQKFDTKPGAAFLAPLRKADKESKKRKRSPASDAAEGGKKLKETSPPGPPSSASAPSPVID